MVGRASLSLSLFLLSLPERVFFLVLNVLNLSVNPPAYEIHEEIRIIKEAQYID